MNAEMHGLRNTRAIYNGLGLSGQRIIMGRNHPALLDRPL